LSLVIIALKELVKAQKRLSSGESQGNNIISIDIMLLKAFCRAHASLSRGMPAGREGQAKHPRREFFLQPWRYPQRIGLGNYAYCPLSNF
jgi:hypothetical protein